MSSDHAGHLGCYRLDPEHPAHDPAQAGDELIQVYEAVDRACGELIEEAGRLFGEEPTVDRALRPRHEADLLDVSTRTAGSRRPDTSATGAARCSRSGAAASTCVAKVDQRLARTTRPLRARARPRAVPAAAPRRPRVRRRRLRLDARVLLRHRRPDLPRRGERRARATAASPTGSPTSLAAIRHPETGEPAFDVRRKAELYHGPYLDKAPELVILPRDERIHVESSRRPWPTAFERHETLDPVELLRLLGSPRPLRDPRRLRSRNQLVGHASVRCGDRPASGDAAAAPRARGGRPRRRAARRDPGRRRGLVKRRHAHGIDRRRGARLHGRGGARAARAPPRPRLRVARPTRHLVPQRHSGRLRRVARLELRP